MGWCSLKDGNEMKLLCRTQTARGTRYDSTLPYCINFWRNQKGSRNARFFTHSENRCLVIDVNQVVDEVNRLADKLVAYLCDSQTIQECRVAWGLQSFCYTGPTSNLDLTTSKLRKLCQDLLSFCICFPIYIFPKETICVSFVYCFIFSLQHLFQVSLPIVSFFAMAESVAQPLLDPESGDGEVEEVTVRWVEVPLILMVECRVGG